MTRDRAVDGHAHGLGNAASLAHEHHSDAVGGLVLG